MKLPPDALAAAALLALAPASLALPDVGDTERASTDSLGGEANERSDMPALSADGRYVAFESWATNLAPGSTLLSKQIYVKDRVTGATTRVSKSTAGASGNHNSFDPDISADGRYVVFRSKASNLVSGDTNDFEDGFLHDRAAGTTTRISVGYAAQSNGHSSNCRITPDGRFVVFTSVASNLVPGDTNSAVDVFRRDLITGTNLLVSVSTAGVQGNGSLNSAIGCDVSADGQTVAFASGHSNLVEGDTNNQSDVFVRDVVAGLTTRISESSAGLQGNSYSWLPTISADGGRVVFESFATTLVPGDVNGTTDVFVHTRASGETKLVSVSSSGVPGNSWSYGPRIGADGTRVAFYSWSSNLVPGDPSWIDVFVRDLTALTTSKVSVTSGGVPGDYHSDVCALSDDGRFVAFRSDAKNLVPGDTNGYGDVFVHEYAAAPPVAHARPTAFASSHSFVAVAPVQPGGLARAATVFAGTTLRVQAKAGLVPSGWSLASAAFRAEVATAAIPAKLASPGPPLVFGAAPAYGAASGGQAVAIHGFNLADGSGTAEVELAGVPASGVSTSSNTLLSATTGAGANPFGNPLGAGAVEVTTADGTAESALDFVYGPALSEAAAPSIGSVYPLRLHLTAGSLYLLARGSSMPGVALPVSPFDGALEIPLGLVMLTGLKAAPADLVTLTFPIPDDPGLVGAPLELQAAVITSIAPLAGSFTNRLATVVQP